jgi:hypothetical protein
LNVLYEHTVVPHPVDEFLTEQLRIALSGDVLLRFASYFLSREKVYINDQVDRALALALALIDIRGGGQSFISVLVLGLPATAACI